MRTIAKTSTSESAHQIHGILEENEISASVFDEASSTILPSQLSGGFRVAVEDSDVAAAQKILGNSGEVSIEVNEEITGNYNEVVPPVSNEWLRALENGWEIGVFALVGLVAICLLIGGSETLKLRDLILALILCCVAGAGLRLVVKFLISKLK